MKQKHDLYCATGFCLNKIMRSSVILLLGIAIIACTTIEKKQPIPTTIPLTTPTNLKSIVSPTDIIVTTPVTMPLKITPTIFPASMIIATDKISSILLGKQGSAQIAVDNDYVYWAAYKSKYLYRILYTGGKPEKIAISQYADGRVDVINPIVSGRWIIFGDTPRSNDLGVWKIRAVNLDTFSERLILDDNQGKNSIYTFDISAEGDWAAWTVSTLKGNNQSDETIISMLNLNTGETRDVKREKVNGSIWSVLSISGSQAVVERDFDENHGAGCSLYLLNTSNGDVQELSTDGKSSMPQFIYPWVMWKPVLRYASTGKVIIYNLQTYQKLLIPIPGVYNADPKMDGARIYWIGDPTDSGGASSIYVFDIIKNTTFELDPPDENQSFQGLAIHGNLIVWVRQTDYLSANTDAFLEWAKIQ